MTSNTSNMLPTNVTLAVEDFTTASDTLGLELHIRNKRPASMKTFSAEQTLLMVHGATYSSGSLFDVKLGGVSFMVPEEKKSDLIPCGWFEKWANATIATDPGSKMHPKTIRVPNGAILDIREFWTAGRKVYDPKDISVAVLVPR